MRWGQIACSVLTEMTECPILGDLAGGKKQSSPLHPPVSPLNNVCLHSTCTKLFACTFPCFIPYVSSLAIWPYQNLQNIPDLLRRFGSVRESRQPRDAKDFKPPVGFGMTWCKERCKAGQMES